MDHVELLGNDIKRTAWHKAGIFKHGCPAFLVAQSREVELESVKRAEETGVRLQVVQADTLSRTLWSSEEPQEQKTNAALALALADAFLRQCRPASSLTLSELAWTRLVFLAM